MPTSSVQATLLARLVRDGLWLCTVESCTGGLLAHRITSVPGASAAYWGSLLTYDDSAKTSLARVPPALLAAHGAVSREVAVALAEGGLRALESAGRRGVCVSTTGIAGPAGGSVDKPVGLCWLGVARSGQPARAERVQVDAATVAQGRDAIKEAFSDRALQLAADALG